MPFRKIPDVEGYLVNKRGEVYSQKTEKLLLPQITKHGYLQVNLSGEQRKIHELVLTTFKGVRPKGMESRHLDGDKLNNFEDNLEWGTRSQNTKDQIRHGTFNSHFVKGENHYNATLSDLEVKLIRSMVANGAMQKEAAKVFGVNPATISRIVSGRRR